MQEKGNISIHTENIFPVIKKFLYSDNEIFLRELVSNAVDATQKLKRLASLGQYAGEVGDTTIEISFDETAKTITISDKGIGMTAEEVKKYINQIAFSGATEFMEKFKEAKDANEIIGRFGLGFYSAFMVADKVEIQTLSYQDGAQAAKWVCDGSTSYEISEGERTTRGTDVILYINKESEEFLNKAKLDGILNKYCRFLPVAIKFGTKTTSEPDGEDEEGKPKYKSVEVDNIINNTNPAWTKAPSELKDEDYLNFYRELYPFSEEPLFWIHLNVDYPFNLTGILYFPKIKNDFDLQRNKIKLFSRQVFITDEVKDIVPEFLMLLHGVIDSPDIPLNVSRSFLQADSNVKRISNYITKKVADKLSELFKTDRKGFEEKWKDIGLFVKYGMVSEDKFAEKANDFALVQNVDKEFYTLKEYAEKVKDIQKDKNDQVIYLYANDAAKQDSFISGAKTKGYDVLLLDSPIDGHFVSYLEQKTEKTQLKRVDSDVLDKLIQKDETKELALSEEESTTVKSLFEKAIKKDNMQVEVTALSADEMPVTVTMDEFMRRMKDMAQNGGGMSFYGNLPDNYKVSVNGNHPLIKRILTSSNDEEKENLAKQAFDLALLSNGLLTGPELTNFVKRSVSLID
ncbi:MULTISPECIES: molecular chaperone HtpG [Olivibacter]|jgi:molecular chaperone HtpG|uniref:Chaperone protein HtpG n=2 Tax=Sphingobacteriaceae TaxID=84566 RepID=F4C435_SPHS2|nr:MULTISPECIES: molecular chaperone HtpG [unclassified Olivibacter]MCL4642165.1 molecular chaperone HtpG [Olivibacter sp. UJ_SKK_5.1]MDM8175107.1 molecular chaperone HtpG [Olivibacter sp. 47]MDX3913211.1 molecular chaperone HtpG [Pseudosphingobacterium sp.]QEL01884.1 molecular chaperone HtpG [Olivibacter sp. LS-1]